MSAHSTRRGVLLGGVAGVAVAAPSLAQAAAGAVSPDAELIRLCDQWIGAEVALEAWDAANSARSYSPSEEEVCDEEERLGIRHDDQEAMLDRLRDLRAVTPEGVLARARLLASHFAWKYSLDTPHTWSGRLLDYLMRDAVALSSASHEAVRYANERARIQEPAPEQPAAPYVSPDRELIEAAQTFIKLEMDFLAHHYGVGRIEDEHEREATDGSEERERAQVPLLTTLCDTPAQTLSGIIHKARAIVTYDVDGHDDPPELVKSLMRDLVMGYDPIAEAKRLPADWKGDLPPVAVR